MSFPKDLQEKIDLWLEYDGNKETRDEILQLSQDVNNTDELHERMDERIQFGTAGLRSSMEAGWSRMNTLTVLQASQGLCSYIKTSEPKEHHSIVIGHDHRFHSRDFAEICAKSFLLQGFKVYYLNCALKEERTGNSVANDVYCHTPLVPFAINELKAGCGVMVTASHNPAKDNGFKVYYKNGCQIIPPHDHLISDEIIKNLKPQPRVWSNFNDIVDEFKENFIDVKFEMTKKYIERVVNKLVTLPKEDFSFGKHKLSDTSEQKDDKDDTRSSGGKPWFVYTPMHGVGYEIFSGLMDKLGLKEKVDYLVVEEQKTPDPSFPTVSFPNPEEKGALDLAIQLAKKMGIHLVVANDPDADRFSVATFHESKQEFQQLNGNEIGYLFAAYEVQKNKSLNESLSKGISKGLGHPVRKLGMLNSTVSSSLLKYMGEKEDFVYEETLTGFKWIGNKAMEMEKKYSCSSEQDRREVIFEVPFSYEEAIGYMFPCISYDKDGISALVVFLQLYIKNKGMLFNALDEIYQKYGYFKQHNDYYIVPNPKKTSEVFSFIRAQLEANTRELPIGDSNAAYSSANRQSKNKFVIKEFRDLTTGYQTNRSVPDLPVDASSEMITFWIGTLETENELKVTMRGSGTEPKLKIYIECMNKTSATESQKYADLLWDSIRTAWIRPEITGVETRSSS